jgi:prepilin-type N-terminal cleavage/methylation domain-containing protein
MEDQGMDRAAPGMTLIEIMIAVSVLAIAMLGLLTAMPVATQATRDAEEHEIARHAIEEKIAEIRAAGWAKTDAFDGTVEAVTGLKQYGNDAECLAVTIAVGPDGTKAVNVIVRWRGLDKVARQVAITTLVGQ